MNSEPFNAEAGPSNVHNHAPLAPSFSLSISSPSSPMPSTRPPPAPSIPSLYLAPPGPPLPQTVLSSTQDLISRFNLLPAYDKYVRQNVPPTGGPSAPAIPDIGVVDQPTPSVSGGVVGGVDKGKGKERDGMMIDGQAGVGVPLTGGPGVAGSADDGTDKGEKKRKNTYKHLIKGIPGKHSMKKDDYLATMMLIPPKQRIEVTPFDARTQRDAFSVSLEGLKGWNIHTLVLESPQAREDRKKRVKELKRLAKAQAAVLAARQSGAPVQDQSAQQTQVPVPTTAQPRPQAAAAGSPNGVTSPRPTGASTPRSNLNAIRPSAPTTVTAVAPIPVKVEAQPTLAPNTVPRPGSTVPRPKSTVPRPGSTKPPIVAGQAAVSTSGAANTGTPLRSGTPMQVDQQRGTKREREDNVVNGAAVGNGHAPPTIATGASMMMIDPKPGFSGVRPRPIKKQRMDMQGQARDVAAPVQQPTPQGV